MSTFALKRGYELQLPMRFVEVDREEMEYVDGGGTFRIQISSNSFIISMLATSGGYLTIGGAKAILGAATTAIAGAIVAGTAGLGSILAGIFMLNCAGFISTLAGAAVSYGVNSLKGRTFTVGTGDRMPNYTLRI